MRHIISATVANKPGVLARVAGLFTARGFNIESLAVGETECHDRSRLTMVVKGDDRILEQVRKQLAKLIDTIKVQDYAGVPIVERDLMLVKIAVGPAERGEVLELAQIFRGRIVDVSETSLILEVSGTEEKVNAFLKVLDKYEILEMVRSGRIAMARGNGKEGK